MARVPSVVRPNAREPRGPAASGESIDLVFDNNRLASALCGEFDQNLALIEQRLDVDARARGNMVTLSGAPSALGDGAARAGIALRPADRRPRHRSGRRGGRHPHGGGGGRAAALPTLAESGRVQLARIATRKKSVVARTPMQDAYIRAMDRNELVFGVGPAGTGKTYLAVAFACAMLERGEVERIILSRPAVEAGERLGFLPGDMREKVDPYLRPLYDALYDMMPGDRVERGLTSGIIEVAPLAFMRGRTLTRAAIILDEAQNATHHADEDVSDAARRGSKDDRHRRPDADRPAARHDVGAERGDADFGWGGGDFGGAVHRGGCGAASAGAADCGGVRAGREGRDEGLERGRAGLLVKQRALVAKPI